MHRRWLLVIVPSLLFVAGCSQVRVKAGQTQRGISPLATDAPENYIPGQNEYNAAATCPLCARDIRVQATTPAVKCAGSVYYFCCPKCKEQFKKSPPPPKP